MNNLFKGLAMFILLLSSFNWSNVYAQQQDDPRRSGYWFLGFGTGAAWQQADIKPSLGWGFDFNFGSNLFYKSTSALSLDWRFNSLFALSNSNDHTLTLIKDGHPLSAPTAWSYRAGSPITRFNNYFGKNVYLNNETFMVNLGLDFRLNFESLRRKAKIHLAVYGGPSLGIFSTSTDQVGLYNNVYNYDLINPNRSRGEILSDLSAMRDGIEDVDLVDLKLAYMTNLGVELGYWFTPNFSMGVGHKWTFTHRDNFDGEFSNVRKANDIHHYTNLFFRWNLGRGSASYSARVRERAVITMLSHNCGSAIKGNTATFKAKVTNIKSTSEVKVYVNGKLSSNYYYSKSSEQVVINTVLRGGENEILIEADNGEKTSYSCTFTSVSETNNNTVVEPQPQSVIPSVTITYPANNTVVTNCNTNVSINTTNASVIYLTVNGARVDNSANFALNQYNVNLNKGRNEIVVHVENGYNRKQSSIIVYCNEPEVLPPPPPPVVKNPPTVQFTLPVGNPFTSANQVIDLTAVTTNVDFQSQVQVNVNGQNYTNFNFSFVNSRVNINNVTLNPGQNTISIHVTNEDGNSSDSKVVYYNAPTPPPPPPVVNPNPGPLPTVKFTDPNVSPYTTQLASISLVALTTNVSRAQDITVYVNNRSHAAFSYNNNKVNIRSVGLQEGANTIQIQVRNANGQASDDQVIVYTPNRSTPPPPPVVKNPPTVQFTAPNGNPYTSTTNTITLTAVTTHISNQNQVSVSVNGANHSNFFFNASRNNVSINNANLVEGNNIVTITVRNNDGQASDNKTIVYTAPRQAAPPTVRFTAPSGNPYTSAENTASLTAATTNITAQNQITVSVNGRQHTNFTFNNNRQTVAINGVSLSEGNNTVSINVSNQDGQASDNKTIVYTAPRQAAPPTVRFTAPSGNPYTSAENTASLTAATTNITAQNQITVSVNGRQHTNFTFNNNRQTVAINGVSLSEGNNTVSINVSNQDGQASDNKTIVYTAPRQAAPPTVRFTAPSGNPYTSAENTASLTAATTNITAQNQITVSVNGRQHTNFTFNNNRQTVAINGVSLSEGNNTVSINVSNQDGQASDNKTIVYTAPRQAAPPTVQFTAPSGNPATARESIVTLTATTTNITAQNQITVKVNNQPYSNFSFDAARHTITIANYNLPQGETDFAITVQNQDGQASTSKTVIYKAPLATVVITTPSANPHNIQTATQTIVATTTQVNSASDIDFKVNGNRITNFTFANNTITATNVTLQEGPNNVVIMVNNGQGIARTTINVTLPRPTTPAPIISNMNATQRQGRTSGGVQVSAKIQHHYTTNGIEFYANGQRVANFTLQNGDFYAENVPFTEGTNTYMLVINGEGGRASMSCVLNQSAGTTDNTGGTSGRGSTTTTPPTNTGGTSGRGSTVTTPPTNTGGTSGRGSTTTTPTTDNTSGTSGRGSTVTTPPTNTGGTSGRGSTTTTPTTNTSSNTPTPIRGGSTTTTGSTPTPTRGASATTPTPNTTQSTPSRGSTTTTTPTPNNKPAQATQPADNNANSLNTRDSKSNKMAPVKETAPTPTPAETRNAKGGKMGTPTTTTPAEGESSNKGDMRNRR